MRKSFQGVKRVIGNKVSEMFYSLTRELIN